MLETSHLLVFLLLFVACVRAEPVQADYFEAKDGNDYWSGRLASPNPEKTDGPFASFSWALDTLKNSPVRGGKLLLRGGVIVSRKDWSSGRGTPAPKNAR